MDELGKGIIRAKLNNALSSIDNEALEIERRTQAVIQSIQTFTENLLSRIQESKQELIAKAEYVKKESLSRLESSKSELLDEEVKKMIINNRLHVDEFTSSGNYDVSFKARRDILERLISEGIGQLQANVIDPRRCTIDGVLERTVGLHVGVERHLAVTTRNVCSEQAYNTNDNLTVEVQPPGDPSEDARVMVMDTTVDNHENGSYKVTLLSKDQGTFDVSVKINGEHIRPSPLEVRSRVKPRAYKRVLLTFGATGTRREELDGPWGLAVNENNEIAVSDYFNNRVQLFDDGGIFRKSFGEEGSRIGKFLQPRGICWDELGNIIVSDSGSNRIQVFNREGRCVRCFPVPSPHGLSVEDNGNLVVTDTKNKAINVYTPSGKLLLKMGDETNFSFPFQCVRYQKRFYVTDFHEHCVKVFDESGNFVFEFGTKGTREGEVCSPAGLAIDSIGQVLVCDSDNHRVQIFNVDGTYVSALGVKGTGLGQFFRPYGVAVFTDGRVAVSDFFEDRIQIFA